MLEDAETGFTNAPEEEEHDERSDANARREACRAVIAQIVSKAAFIKVCFVLGKKIRENCAMKKQFLELE